MKKLLLAIILCAGFAASVFGQSNPPLRLQEIDGSPNVLGVTTIKVTNGTLSCSGKVCTITISGGGGGSPGGSTTQLQYNNAGAFGGITGATTDGTAVTLTSPILVTPAIGVATGTSLTITGAFRTSTANQRIYFGIGSNSFRWSDGVGPYFIDNTATGGLVFNMQSLSSDRTFTWPNASGTVTTIAGTQTLTNKTVTDSTNVLGGVTMTLGSDATGDVYYRNASGILTRVAAGAQNTVFTMGASSVPSWAAASGGGITVGTTTITSGTNTRVLYNNAGVVGEYTVTGSGNAVLSASPTLTGTVGMAAQTNTGTITQTSASATAFESGPNGGTNPVFRLVNNVSSAATGLSITGNAAAAGADITVLSSGSNESLNLLAKGTGRVNVATVGGLSGVLRVIGSTSSANYFEIGSADSSTSYLTSSSGNYQLQGNGQFMMLGNRLIKFYNSGFNAAIGSDTSGLIEVNSGTLGQWRDLKVRQHYVDQTITAGGTTGNQTINKAAGTVNFAAAATAITVTNSLASTSSTIYAIARTNDATCHVANVVPGSGSFVINMTAACTAETSVGFLVVNF